MEFKITPLFYGFKSFLTLNNNFNQVIEVNFNQVYHSDSKNC